MSAAPAPTMDRATAQAAAKKASAIFDEPANAETVKKVMEAAAGDMGKDHSQTLLSPVLARLGDFQPKFPKSLVSKSTDNLCRSNIHPSPSPPPLTPKDISNGSIAQGHLWRHLVAATLRLCFCCQIVFCVLHCIRQPSPWSQSMGAIF